MPEDSQANRLAPSVRAPRQMRPATPPRPRRNRRGGGSVWRERATTPPGRRARSRVGYSSLKPTSHRRHRHYGAHLDRAHARARNSLGDADRFIEILRIDEVIATELFARLRERAIG